MLAKFDPPLHLRSLLAPPGLPQAFPFDQPGCRLHFSGRYALWAAIQALALPRGAEVLLPSYNCGTEVEPFLRAGLAPRFYRVGRQPRLRPGAPRGPAAARAGPAPCS